METGVLCLGNSCRSIMAEALARYCFPDSLRFASAGIYPLGFVAPETLQVLAEWGVPTAGLRSKGLEEFSPAAFSLLVNLTSSAVASQLPWDYPGRIVTYPVVDPFGDTLEAYRRARDLIHRFVTEDLPAYLPGVEAIPECLERNARL